jgi:two-component system, OmpR family, alkaline phosphatase synthesis response regulator PhoP
MLEIEKGIAMSHRVLLCDDEIHILRAAEFKLSRAGLDVVCKSNGLEAWEEILRQKPDILITDCQMPRLDGLGLCKRIRENPATRDLPVLMLTAKGYELSHTDMKETYGILAVIAKPFSPRELLDRVNETLNYVEAAAHAD